MEFNFKYLIGFLYLIVLDQPLNGEERSLDPVIGDWLFVHVLIHIEVLIFKLFSVWDEISQICL